MIGGTFQSLQQGEDIKILLASLVVVIVGGMGVDDKAKVKIVDTTVEEPDEDEADAPADSKAGEKGKDSSKEKQKAPAK